MIDTKALKSRILDLAIQGKLTEQLPSDGTAEVLFNINDTSFEEDIPYEVPNNWKWVKLSNIGTTNIGLTYHPSDVDNNGTIVIRSSNIVNGKMDYSDIVKVNCSIKENQYVNKNDIVICARNGSKALVGKNAIYNDESGKVAFGAFMAIFRTEYYAYVHLFFNTKSFRRYFSSDDSKQINQVTQAILKNSIIPLPPLAEQKRIVERVEEIFRLLDTIDKAQEKYSADSQILKAKLITAGIQGKLTKQLESDGTAHELYQQIQAEKQKLIKEGKLKKEKPLPPISPDEIPFEIPQNWMWVRLGEVSINVQYGSSKKSSPEGKIPVIRMGNLQNSRIIYDKLVYTSDDEEIERYQLEYNDLLFNRTNSLEIVGKTAIYKAEMPAIYAGYLVRITPLIDSDYLNFVMQSQYYWKYCESVRSDSIGQSNINAEKLKNFPVLMPPLAEQKRIADVLERVLGEIDNK